MSAGYDVGRAWADGLRRGAAAAQILRAFWPFLEWTARDRAEQAEAHADWYCSLPWWRRQLVLMLGGWYPFSRPPDLQRRLRGQRRLKRALAPLSRAKTRLWDWVVWQVGR